MLQIGMSYQGINSDVKALLWNTISCPILAYGMKYTRLSEIDLQSTLLTHFILKGTPIKGTLLDRIVGADADTLDLIVAKSLSTRLVYDT